uniref:zinc finger BED domain-containing protein 5-like n=1 Tax=Styela clava TaxID=7725 RepID=UPI0019398DF0|nr:zinc finger BED domain-containing protein 5-like [Styela clava]
MEKLKIFFESANLEWKRVCGVCTDGAPAMLGSRSGFQKKVKELAPEAKGTHCAIHRYALASKTLPTPLQNVLDSVVKIVNYIKSGSLNTHQFEELCKDMDSTHDVVFFHIAVQWLPRGNVLNRIFAMKEELKLFFAMKKTEFLSYFNDQLWMNNLTYLADIFEKLNILNLKLQGKGADIIQLNDHMRAFVLKLKNWRRKVSEGNFAMFDRLSSVNEDSEILQEDLKNCIVVEHLDSLQSEFQRYFLDLEENDSTLTRNPFSSSLDVTDVPEKV